jgi:hypothetical protein
MTTSKRADDEPSVDVIGAAGLSHLLPDYEENLTAAMQQAKRHVAELERERELEMAEEPALLFVPAARQAKS